MAFLVILLVLLALVTFLTAPLRARTPQAAAQPGESGLSGGSRLAELEAAREAKYREIRDAELDHATGKLSDADFAAIDGSLRAQAAAILHDLDRVADVATIQGDDDHP